VILQIYQVTHCELTWPPQLAEIIATVRNSGPKSAALIWCGHGTHIATYPPTFSVHIYNVTLSTAHCLTGNHSKCQVLRGLLLNPISLLAPSLHRSSKSLLLVILLKMQYFLILSPRNCCITERCGALCCVCVCVWQFLKVSVAQHDAVFGTFH
jgi:hypothetical protein